MTTPEKRKEYKDRYYARHPEKLLERVQQLIAEKDNIARKRICNILKKHAEDLKDDPERLSTAFLQELIGIKCKREELK